MLPFLNKNIRQGSGVIIKERQPDQDHSEDIKPDNIEDCVDRLLSAISRKDKQEIIQALRDVHDELHLEMNENQGSNTYAEQNKAAAKEE